MFWDNSIIRLTVSEKTGFTDGGTDGRRRPRDDSSSAVE